MPVASASGMSCSSPFHSSIVRYTEGCILVGRNTLPGCLLGSREKLDALMKRLSGRKDGEAVHLTIEEAHSQPLPKGGGTGG